jgi:hypothetical protein
LQKSAFFHKSLPSRDLRAAAGGFCAHYRTSIYTFARAFTLYMEGAFFCSPAWALPWPRVHL